MSDYVPPIPDVTQTNFMLEANCSELLHEAR